MSNEHFNRCLRALTALFAWVAGFSTFATAVEAGASGEGVKPNIVLIYADDQGWKDTGYQSDGAFKTPVLDQMAKEGMVFTDAYANAANCQPARACLLSGNYSARHHVFAVNSTSRGPKKQMRLVPIPNREGLAVEDITVADALKAAGYATGHFGKWHLYDKSGRGGGGALPSQQGFNVTYDSFGEDPLPEGAKGNLRGPSSDPKGVFDLSKQACDFMEANQDRPFFVYLAHHAPHGPVNSRESTREMIEDSYQACVYDLDASVGRVLDKIKQLGIEDKTLVIYTSDNGGSASSQEPLRGEKGMYYEGGIRVPMIAYWPAVIQAGTTCSTPVMQIDFFPTYLELAGAKVDKELDGESLLPLLKQTGVLERTSLFWHMPGYLDRPKPGARDKIFRTRPVSVVRQGPWKLHLYLEEWTLDGGRETIAENNAVELYHLGDDIGERTNLAQQHPDVRDELLTDLLAWHDTVQAAIPTKKNPAYNPSAKKERKKAKPAKAVGGKKKPAQARPGVATPVPSLSKGGRPNILWIVTEDIGCDMACYGTKGVYTPNLDQLAAEGALYTRAYTTASTCSPSRSSFMTGLYPHQVFSKNMRIRPPLKKKALPEGVDIFTKYLREAGYAIGFPGHPKKDWGFIHPKTKPYDMTDWDQLTQQQPFFCQYQFYDTHRVNKKIEGEFFPFLPCPEHPVDRAAIELHPYTPETPEAREELGAYLENINLLDMKIGKLIDDLKAKGLYENTIIVVMGDNGPPIFRGKGFLYERGILMPLIVRVPKGFKAAFEPGTQTDELVSALDMAPTFINLADGTIPEYMEGRIFFGPNKQPAPEHLFAMRDRHDMNVDRCRSVTSTKYKYLRNYVRGMTCYENSLGNVAASKAGKKLFNQGKLPAVQTAYFQEKPEEELYDLENDPFELNNLAHDPTQEETLAEFRAELAGWIKRTGDDGQFEDPDALKEMKRLFDAQRSRQKKQKLKKHTRDNK